MLILHIFIIPVLVSIGTQGSSVFDFHGGIFCMYFASLSTLGKFPIHYFKSEVNSPWNYNGLSLDRFSWLELMGKQSDFIWLLP